MVLKNIFKNGLMFLLRNSKLRIVFTSAIVLLYYGCNKKISGSDKADASGIQALRSGFVKPPDAAKPGVYWYFMDGNLSEEGMTKDLESMAKAGIGNLVFLEVNVGVPRGKVDFLSDRWLELFKHAE